MEDDRKGENGMASKTFRDRFSLDSYFAKRALEIQNLEERTIYKEIAQNMMLELYQEFSDYGYDVSFFDCYKSMYDVLDAAGTMSSFWGELAVGYLLFVVASVSYIINSIRTRAK